VHMSEITVESIELTDEDLQETEVAARWVDVNGISGVAPGTTYVLVRLPRRTYERLLRKYGK